MSNNVADMRAGTLGLSGKGNAESPKEHLTYVEFNPSFSTEGQVVVTAMVQTLTGPQTPILRLSDVSETGFNIRLDELKVSETVEGGPTKPLSDGFHVEETIAWIAVRIAE